MGDLKHRSVRGGAITLSAQGIRFVLQIGSTMILARLVTPADYGLVAMVAAVTGFVAMFQEAGLSSATVQRLEVTQGQVSTLFWLNVALSFLAAAIVALGSPLIAMAYGDARLIPITLVLASTFILGGGGVQHRALLQRQMRFLLLAIIDIASAALAVVAAIIMASFEMGYWALVAMPVTAALVSTVLAWAFSRWRPDRPALASGIRPLLAFGGGLTGFNLLNYLTRNADTALIGAVLGASPAGLYSKAYNLLLMPIRQINAPLTAVAMPVLSRLQADPPRFKRYFLRALSILGFVTIPISAFAWADAENIIGVLLGPQWAEAVPLFQWLAPAGMLGAINITPGWLCQAQGKTGRQFRWAAVSAPVMIVAYVIGLRFGLLGVTIGFTTGWSVMFIVFVAYACRGSPVSFAEVIRTVGPVFVAAIVAAGLTSLESRMLTDAMAPFVALPVDAAVFAIVYLANWYVLADREPVTELARYGLQQWRHRWSRIRPNAVDPASGGRPVEGS